MNIIGQDKIINKINSYTLQTLPHTICFLGDVGSGRHSLVKYMSERFNLSIVFVSNDTTAEELLDFQKSVLNKIYLINLNETNEKSQNKFLKFVEEPSKHAFIVLLATSEIGILNTILNRCMKFKLEEYSESQLKEFELTTNGNVNDLVLKICKTPGQLMSIDYKSFPSLVKLCETIATKIDKAPYANTLSIAQKINYKEDYDKYDFNLFLNTLEYISFNIYKESNSETSYKVYNIVNQYKSKIYEINNSPIKENYILSLLTTLWEATN